MFMQKFRKITIDEWNLAKSKAIFLFTHIFRRKM